MKDQPDNWIRCYWIIVISLFILLSFILIKEGFGQTPGPTPNPSDYSSVQAELESWWGWCIVHPQCIFRISKKYELPNAERPYEERLKVPGPPWNTPFGSMRRWRTYRSFVNSGGNTVLLNNGWNFQTLAETGIGEGMWDKIPWGSE